MSKQQTEILTRADEIQVGDVIRVAVNSIEGEHAVAATEVSPHGEHAIELAQGTVIIAESWNLFHVARAEQPDLEADEAAAWREDDLRTYYGIGR